MRHTEFVFPVVVGTCAFYLGKKVDIPHAECPQFSMKTPENVESMLTLMATICRLQKLSPTSGISTCAD